MNQNSRLIATVNAKNNNSLPIFFKNMGPLFGVGRNLNKTQQRKTLSENSSECIKMCVNTDFLNRSVATIT